MKVLIISSPKADRVQIAAARHKKMIDLLREADIEAHSEVIHTHHELSQSIDTTRPDIVYCAQDLICSDSKECFRVHSYLDRMKIPYIGSSSDTLSLVLSKSMLKHLWNQDGVLTPAFTVINKGEKSLDSATRFPELDDYPYILKPDGEGNSRGLDENSVVFDKTSLKRKAHELFEIYDSVMVEKYLGNTIGMQEFTVAMIGNGPNRLIMPAELSLKQKKRIRIITTEDKDNPNTLARPVLDATLRKRIIDFSTKAFLSSGVRDYARCDVIMANDRIYAIEINGQPMIPDKWFEMCAKGSDLGPVQYLSAIFLAGITRNNRTRPNPIAIPVQFQRFLPPDVFSVLTSDG